MAHRTAPDDRRWMERALELALRGEGAVEPNPMVGAVVVRDGNVVGEGWHQHFGGPHAEVHALRSAGGAAQGATIYVTLEPCCHHGKTPPCTQAIADARIERVVAAEEDPTEEVGGKGFKLLRDAGIQVETGVLADTAQALNAPFHKLVTQGRPWVIAKWAMTLDGKIATAGGDSKWISNKASRACVHQIRGRMDAILVGGGTALADDPRLNARPAGVRTALRVVFSSRANLRPDSHLVATAGESPTLVVAGKVAGDSDRQRLIDAGCEVLILDGRSPVESFSQLLDELGRRRFTNVLIEGGGTLLGTAFDADEIDEVHAFIAPKILGGANAIAPIMGAGGASIAAAPQLDSLSVETLDGDVYIHGRLSRGSFRDPTL